MPEHLTAVVFAICCMARPKPSHLHSSTHCSATLQIAPPKLQGLLVSVAMKQCHSILQIWISALEYLG